MVSRFPSTDFTSTNPSVFTHNELRQVLSAYGEGVMNKGWRDYAIASEPKQTTFCVIEHGQGAPIAVIYSISKTRSSKSSGRDYFRVFEGEKQVFRSESFLEALSIFRQIGMPGTKKGKKFKVID